MRRSSSASLLLVALAVGAVGCGRGARPVKDAPPEAESVSPRPVLRAIPADAEWVLFLPRTQGTLEGAVDFLERALQGLAAGLAERQAFARYALELSGGPPPEETGLDPAEGLAAFLLPEPAVLVAAVGIADEARALEFARRQFAVGDARVLRHDAGSLLIESAELGDRLLAFADRGYLYVARLGPELVASDAEARLLQKIRGSSPLGLEQNARLQRLRPKVAEADAYLFLPRLNRTREDAVLAGLRFTADALEIEGLVEAPAPVWPSEWIPAANGSGLPLLEEGPEGPVLAATLSLPPRTLSELVLAAGLPAAAAGPEEARGAIDALAEVLTGEAWIAGWVDAERTGERMAAADGSPTLAGTVWAELGIRDRKRAILWVDELLGRSGLGYRVEDHAGAARFEVRHPQWPARIEVRADRVTVKAGEPLGPRRTVPLAEGLRARSFPGSFGPSRVSVALDAGQLLRELDPSDGDLRARESAMRALLVSFVTGFSAVDALVLDVSPAAEGARFQGRVMLR